MPKSRKRTHEHQRKEEICHTTTTAKVMLRDEGKGTGAQLLLLLTLALLMNISCVACARDHRKQTNLEAKVGSHVVFNCYIDFPYDSPIPYVVHWSKDVSQAH